ncbi:MAG: hypothetical protein WCG47_23640 [Dermatophilaceae bacterium]
MAEHSEDPGGDREAALMERLFSPSGRSDPAAVALLDPVPGCAYDFVSAAMRDRRLVAAGIPASDDLTFQVAGRFLARLDPARHNATRAVFTGIFSPRRVEL